MLSGELAISAADDLKALYKARGNGAVDDAELSGRQKLLEFVEELLKEGEFDFSHAPTMRALLVAIDDYANRTEISRPQGKGKSEATTTQVVRAVGVMIRLREENPRDLGTRRQVAAELVGFKDSRVMRDETNRKLSLFRKAYIQYIAKVLGAHQSRNEILGALRRELEEHIDTPYANPLSEKDSGSSRAQDRRTAEKQRTLGRVLDGGGLYATLRKLYPCYELVDLWGVTMPICAFPADPSKWGEPDSVLGQHPKGELPGRAEYSEDFDEKGREEFDMMVERYKAASAEERKKLFNGPTYSLDKIHLPTPGSPLKIDFKFGRFFTKEVTCEGLDAEMMAALRADPDRPVALGRRIGMRTWLHDQVDDPVIDGRHRDGAVSHATVIMLANTTGTYDLFLTRRTGDVATHPYFSHVCPSGIFSPHSNDPAGDRREFSVVRNFYREFSEEMYNKPEHERPPNDWDEDPDPEKEPEVQRLIQLIDVGDATLSYTGVSINLLTLRPEICLLLRIEDPEWLDRERKILPPARGLRLNWEYLLDSADEVQLSKKQPTHWRVILSKQLRRANGQVFEPSWTVPNAAAAVKLAFETMHGQL